MNRLVSRVGSILPLATLLALASCEITPVHSDPVTAFHGEKQLELLVAPAYVESFRLDPHSYGNADPGDRFAGYAVIEVGPRLVERQQLDIFPLFLDETCYGFDFEQGCEFTPGLGLRFARGVDHVDVLVCFECNEWQFEHDGRVVGEEFHRKRARAVLVSIARELFPNDAVIRRLRAVDD